MKTAERRLDTSSSEVLPGSCWIILFGAKIFSLSLLPAIEALSRFLQSMFYFSLRLNFICKDKVEVWPPERVFSLKGTDPLTGNHSL